MKYLALYLLIINLAAAVLCAADKSKARAGRRRISEKALFITSIIGGSVGMFATMCAIRHKTRHKRFMIGLPLIIIIQSVLFVWLLHIVA